MSSDDISDFYMILPSNACPHAFPHNNASKYTVTWERPNILTGGGWKVALVEANMPYTKWTVASEMGIKYDLAERLTFPKFDMTLHFKVKNFVDDVKIFEVVKLKDTYSGIDKYDLGFVVPDFYLIFHPNDKIPHRFQLVVHAKLKFTLTFHNKDTAKVVGFNQIENISKEHTDGHWRVVSEELVNPSKWANALDVTFSIEYAPQIKMDHIWNVLYEYKRINTNDDLCKAVGTWLNYCFVGVSMNPDDLMVLKVKPGIIRLQFLAGLNTLLGFSHVYYSFGIDDDDRTRTITADFSPSLNKGIPALYIYSSVCEPINVGGALVPLLRSVWFQSSHNKLKEGEMINHVIEHPMYIPVAATTINSIEINIRTDSGDFVPFQDGAITSLTLHFKKWNRY